ncbi:MULTISPECIES: esterase FrsA [Aeromonas]|uniref:Esterase FrsA n=5 Tax=Gammaproteobacteria TaxID=1236 RepID=A0A653KRR8_AERVE|nr:MULTISPECIES: esterase FrsA [Aeromonas]MCR6550967.1 esterase FrsA [Aeromonas sp. CPF2-S1]HDN9003212.1 esterase FrsA [Aeromonas veronii AMC24]AEB51325.1 Esterase YafA [Aeromonas veronii B565]ANB70553.1 fermentation/respiration switch protein [Aeromonas veronii]ATY82407.1 esterase FrsA [Aeromonas veronii]
MDLNEDLNLTEQLFTRVKKVLETSEISNSSAADLAQAESDEMFIDGSMSKSWYRLLRRPSWTWQGADPIEVEQTLARIAMATGERTHDCYLDTIKGYVPGNWIYEWSQVAGNYFKQGRELREKGDPSGALKQLLKAVRYYSIASYPHLKDDELADQAQLLGNMAYREAGRLFKVPLKEIQVPFRGKHIQGYLHLPTTEKPVPLVIISGGIDSLQLDFLNFYLKRLEPNGIGMLSLDMPGVGYAEHWPLVQDTSRLHQAVLHYLSEVAWVDHQRIAMVGMRLAGNIAARLAFIEPFKLRTVVCVGAGVNQVFTNQELFAKCPRMMRDSLANRLGADAAQWDGMRTKCQVFSLKTQGLLGTRTSVPILSIGHKRDFICPEQDVRALAAASRNGKAIVFDKQPLLEVYDKALDEIVEWLKQHLCT